MLDGSSYGLGSQIHKYWTQGVVPTEAHTFTGVDELGFQTIEQAGVAGMAEEDRALVEAWARVGEAMFMVN